MHAITIIAPLLNQVNGISKHGILFQVNGISYKVNGNFINKNYFPFTLNKISSLVLKFSCLV